MSSTASSSSRNATPSYSIPNFIPDPEEDLFATHYHYKGNTSKKLTYEPSFPTVCFETPSQPIKEPIKVVPVKPIQTPSAFLSFILKK